MSDAAHPSVHQELRELVTFRGPVDSVYKAAPSRLSLDNGSGEHKAPPPHTHKDGHTRTQT